MYKSSAILLAVASMASASIFITEPIATTTCSAGTPCNVRWNDDGTQPTLAMIGKCSIDLCTGGQFQQTCLQNIAQDMDVSTAAYVTYTPQANVGPNGGFYFIKYRSLAFMDPAQPQFPFTAYSAKFQLNNMSGTFNSTVQQQIDGGGAGIVSTPAVVGAASTPAAVVVTRAAASSSSRAASASTSAKATNAAGALTVPGFSGVSIAAGVAGLIMGAFAMAL